MTAHSGGSPGGGYHTEARKARLCPTTSPALFMYLLGLTGDERERELLSSAGVFHL